MAKTKKTPEAAPEPQPAEMESRAPEPYKFEIATTFDTLLSTNYRAEAHAKLQEVKDTNILKFTFIDREHGVMWVYDKEPYQQNYRVTPSDFPPAEPVV